MTGGNVRLWGSLPQVEAGHADHGILTGAFTGRQPEHPERAAPLISAALA